MPPVAEAGFDIRIPPTEGPAIDEKLKKWTDKEVFICCYLFIFVFVSFCLYCLFLIVFALLSN